MIGVYSIALRLAETLSNVTEILWRYLALADGMLLDCPSRIQTSLSASLNCIMESFSRNRSF